ncbi:PREDICTED: uncharacterized protein LOC109593709 [Amphimedon queenslandica]|uniref:Uncharacterized protein n=2 Tax=Amphimedon queenslandica TaxID=400682 RepID=A0AAN0K4W2_AMPQE|nr:PREDICTED: uncharacterized protein LOC109593709 [Amphimedon queenslandica]|eukprot:XP_019864229.1 PREDICTED: uncharacterized protein LOC109593709 [Amphimedon queenslandica]
MTVLGKIEILQERGLKDFILGNCTVWNNTQVVNGNTERADLLAQINDLKAALRDRDERMKATETELAIIKEQSENRLKELKALKMDLEKSQCINIKKEEVINQLKDAMSSLEEKLVEKENMLNMKYLKEAEGNA